MSEPRKMKKSELPKMVPVEKSSNVKSTGYIPEKEEYFVEYTKGDIYVYTKVPQLIVDQLNIYESIGSGISRLLKAAPKLHPFQKVLIETTE